MSLLLRTSTTLLLLPLLTHIVASDFPFKGKPQVTAVMASMLQIQQVKQRILRGLNMTAAPRTLLPDRSRIKVRRPLQEMDRQPNVSMILSEASGDERTDTVSFKLNSKVRAQVQDIELAILVIMLRSNHGTAKRTTWRGSDVSESLENLSKREMAKEKQRKKHKPLDSSNDPFEELLEDERWDLNATADFFANKSSSQIKQTSVNGINTNLITNDNDVRRSQRAKAKRGRSSRQLRRLRLWRVKVVVKAIEPDTGKRRRIAVEKIHVKRSSTMAFPLSKDVLIAAASSSNHTLQLQMTCKRCKGRVHIEKVYKTLRQKSKQLQTKLRLNPDRPYLFITTGSNVASSDIRSHMREDKPDSPNDIARARAKRHTSSTSIATLHSSQNKTVKQGPASYLSCCSQKVQLTLQELGIDFILYPKNVTIMYCVSPCNLNSSTNRNNSRNLAMNQHTFKINYLSSNMEKENCTFINKDNSSGSVDHARCLYAVENVPLPEHEDNYPISRQLNGNCILISVIPTNVIFLSGFQTVKHGHLNHVTYLACDSPCQR